MTVVPFQVLPPTTTKVPVLVSVPHCGNHFPEELRLQFKSQMIEYQEDTDWLVDRLYDFAPSFGITLIRSVYHRWIIDLNRSPENKPLYSDGRVITGLVPLTDFNGNELYVQATPGTNEIESRKRLFYWPYYQKITELLNDLKRDFGQVLFFDAHSIKRQVPGIQKTPFPDLILGDADKRAAAGQWSRLALRHLNINGYNCTYNHPFKGGHLTRYFGKPEQNTHALQLEMAKDLYMDDKEQYYDPDRADKIRTVLIPLFQAFIKQLVPKNEIL